MSTRSMIAAALVALFLLGAGCSLVLFKPAEPFNYIDANETPQGQNAIRAFPVDIYSRILEEGGGVEDRATAAERVVTVLSPTEDLGEVSLDDAGSLGDVLEHVGVPEKPELWTEAAIVRQGTAVRERYIVICDVRELLRYGDLHQDLELRSGDVIFLRFENTRLLDAVFTRFGVVATVIADIDDLGDAQCL